MADIQLAFGGVQALRGVSMEVHRSEFLAIIGPNGAGKTALLNTITGFYRPQEGQVTFDDRSILRMKPHQIASLGIARTFQGTRTFQTMTVLENVMIGRHVHGSTGLLASMTYFPRARRIELAQREAAEEIIEFLELSSYRSSVVGDLGYGIRKRVDLGRALAMEPRMLLLDEPMAGMNQEERQDLARYLLDVRIVRDIPLVLIEHDMNVVTDLADRVIVLDFGEVIAQGTPADVVKEEAVLTAYLGKQYSDTR